MTRLNDSGKLRHGDHLHCACPAPASWGASAARESGQGTKSHKDVEARVVRHLDGQLREHHGEQGRALDGRHGNAEFFPLRHRHRREARRPGTCISTSRLQPRGGHQAGVHQPCCPRPPAGPRRKTASSSCPYQLLPSTMTRVPTRKARATPRRVSTRCTRGGPRSNWYWLCGAVVELTTCLSQNRGFSFPLQKLAKTRNDCPRYSTPPRSNRLLFVRRCG